MDHDFKYLKKDMMVFLGVCLADIHNAASTKNNSNKEFQVPYILTFQQKPANPIDWYISSKKPWY